MSEAFNMLRTGLGLPKEGIVGGRQGGKAGRAGGVLAGFYALCPPLSLLADLLRRNFATCGSSRRAQPTRRAGS